MRIVLTFEELKFKFFSFRYNAPLATKLILAFWAALGTGILAQIKISLAFTPVPITGQTFAVLLAGVLLGKWWGGISQLIYAILGLAGIPWFAGFKGGGAILFGPTGGYILGFILAAFFVGYCVDRYITARSFTGMLAVLLFANFVLIHIPGLIGLSYWLKATKGITFSLNRVLALGTLPFIPGDIFKAVLVALITRISTPKKKYAKEIDEHKWQTWKFP